MTDGGPPERGPAISNSGLNSASTRQYRLGLTRADILAEARREFDVPLAAYHVSGEYAMIHAAAERGWIDGERAMDEALVAIKRAGADWILTYAAKDIAARLPA